MNNTTLKDLHPNLECFLQEVMGGLRQPQKSLPCKYFYDEKGSHLFNSICETKEYYPTRTELRIMHDYISEIVAELGSNCLLIEYGSGSGEKIRLLLDHLSNAIGYVPIDISKEHLQSVANDLNLTYPKLEVLPVCADFTQKLVLPTPQKKQNKKVAYFPGSTIGNFTYQDAVSLLENIRQSLLEEDGFLVGIDLIKDKAILENAYNDKQGYTEGFNKNILERINHELNADFDLDQFQHLAYYNDHLQRIEMHLKSLKDQIVTIDDQRFYFSTDETIHTESSHKYSLAGFTALAKSAGFKLKKYWTDENGFFGVLYFECLSNK